jgi:hypothetical protein
MLTILSRVSSVMVSNNAPRHSCSNGFPSAKFNLIQTSIWPVKTVDTCRSLSSRQNADFILFYSIKNVKKTKKNKYVPPSSKFKALVYVCITLDHKAMLSEVDDVNAFKISVDG